MQRTVIITLAGRSTRFAKSVGYECHKSLYRDSEDGMTILGYQLETLDTSRVGEIILVGGYCYDELQRYVKQYFSRMPIRLVYNSHFVDYGSCYSLVSGINAVRDTAGEIVFMEGDLVVDRGSMEKLLSVPGDVITAHHALIDASTAVAFYLNVSGRLRYIYDTNHRALCIPEPFSRIGNSGQVWKFENAQLLKHCIAAYGETEWKDTNLRPIMDYFDNRLCIDIPIITFEKWYNCNTLSDWRAMKHTIV